MKYSVAISVDATVHVDVEAESKEAAERAAYKAARVSICHQCSRGLDVGDLGDVLDVTELDSQPDRGAE